MITTGRPSGRKVRATSRRTTSGGRTISCSAGWAENCPRSRPVRLTIAATAGVEKFSVAIRGSLLVAVTPRVHRAGASRGMEASPWNTTPVYAGNRSSARRNARAASAASTMRLTPRLVVANGLGRSRRRSRYDDAREHAVGFLRNARPTPIVTFRLATAQVVHGGLRFRSILSRQPRSYFVIILRRRRPRTLVSSASTCAVPTARRLDIVEGSIREGLGIPSSAPDPRNPIEHGLRLSGDSRPIAELPGGLAAHHLLEIAHRLLLLFGCQTRCHSVPFVHGTSLGCA